MLSKTVTFGNHNHASCFLQKQYKKFSWQLLLFTFVHLFTSIDISFPKRTAFRGLYISSSKDALPSTSYILFETRDHNKRQREKEFNQCRGEKSSYSLWQFGCTSSYIHPNPVTLLTTLARQMDNRLDLMVALLCLLVVSLSISSPFTTCT